MTPWKCLTVVSAATRRVMRGRRQVCMSFRRRSGAVETTRATCSPGSSSRSSSTFSSTWVSVGYCTYVIENSTAVPLEVGQGTVRETTWPSTWYLEIACVMLSSSSVEWSYRTSFLSYCHCLCCVKVEPLRWRTMMPCTVAPLYSTVSK